MRYFFLLIFISFYTAIQAQTAKPFADIVNYNKHQNSQNVRGDFSAPPPPPPEKPLYDKKMDVGEGFTAALKDGKWGLLKEDNTVLPFSFDNIEYFYQGYARIKKDNQYGFINWQGELVLEPKYEEVAFLPNGFLMVKTKGLWGIMGQGKTWAVQPIYEAMKEMWKRGFLKVKQNNKEGLLSPTFKVIAPPQYDRLADEILTKNDTCITVFKEGKLGVIDYTGRLIIPLLYDKLIYMAVDTFFVSKANKFGIINSQNKELAPFVYDNIFGRDKNLIVVINEKEGLLNSKFQLIVPCEYNYIGEFYEGIAKAIKNYKQGFLNDKGEVLCAFIYDDISFFSQEGLAIVTKNKQRGLLNKKGQLITEDFYDQLESSNNESVYLVRRDLKYGYLSIRTGAEEIALLYDRAGNFKNGKAPVRLGDSLFYIDRTGKKLENIAPDEVIKFSYESNYRLQEGFFRVMIDGKYGFCNVLGREIISAVGYNYACDFSEGLAAVDKDGKRGFINTEGKVVIPFEFDNQTVDRGGGDRPCSFKEGLAPVAKNGKYGFINTQGKTIIDFKYSVLFPLSEGLALAQLDGRLCGFIDKEGKVIIPFAYTYGTSFNQGKAQVGTKEGSFWINTKGEIIK